MKFFVLIAWTCGIVAALIMITAAISLISDSTLFGVRRVVNYFHATNSILLMGILCVLAHQGCQMRKN